MSYRFDKLQQTRTNPKGTQMGETMSINMKKIYVNPDGQWWSSFEYNKHHQEEYPFAQEFEIIEHNDHAVDRAYTDVLADALANYL